MTALNRAIKEVKDGAEVVFIKPNDVRTIAEHCRMTMDYPSETTVDDLAEKIRQGALRLMGVPVRLFGRPS